MARTQCNYCRLRDIRKQAKEDGKKVTLIHDGLQNNRGGTRVFVHPADVNVQKIDEDRDHPLQDYCVGWMLVISDECACEKKKGRRRCLKIYTVIDKPGSGKNFWLEIGTASENKDGSISAKLDVFPVNGMLQIRPEEQ